VTGIKTYVTCGRLPDLQEVARRLQRGVLVLDTETTGLYLARGDRLVSVGALAAAVGWCAEVTCEEVDGYYVLNGPIGWELNEIARRYHKVDRGLGQIQRLRASTG
jgi:hypothetical protein